MTAPTRQAMRLLSPRIQCLHAKPSTGLRQLRHASSRYSNPAKRTGTTVASQPSSFIGSSNAAESARPAGVPLDARIDRKAWEEKQEYHKQRMRFAGMGIVFSFGAMVMTIWNLDLDAMGQSEQKRRGQQLDASSEANARFQGKEVHIVGAGEDKRIVAQGDGEEILLVETGTSSVPHFPRTIYLPASSDSPAVAGTGDILAVQPNAAQNPGNAHNQEEYTLVGLGIRTVMWIQVYVVGMYIRTQDIATLQEKLIHSINPTASTLIPSEKDGLRQRLLDPEQSRQVWSELLKVPGIKTAFRISPTRGTDFGHLRDGFVNGINARKAEARKKVAPGQETEFDSEDFGMAVQNLKGIFAGGKAPKGSVLILHRDEKGALDVLYQPKPESKDKQIEHLGSVPDERVSKLIWLGYLAGDKVSSKAARDGVVEGCISFASRPVGSVETMVT
ncbi:Altered inheritance of mitochondria protein 18, mitochondrial [Teratosphaeria destructans]|uniref:Altered inheritance of mitochondria protein 18, mitochondrial n=1 Tax=Teratosphaeria destructans TaxID=418781 RepID=A0A9W7SVK7_9PEZI|nr:Altered inheritance of mitochondria protein 18, mitochondrial [Teratosphaeria destructans]